MVRLLILLLLLPFATSASPLAPIGRESGDELLARCEPALRLIEAGNAADLDPAQRDAGISCMAFVDGFIWGHSWSAWRERSDMFYCPPEGFSARQGVPALVEYLREHPHRRIQRAHLLIFAAFNHAFPCVPLPAAP
ncbi:MAG TPA: Rap1a/Tai family immunity protein [Burkholderiales bacterium]